MSQLISATLTDLRFGRESWRVLFLLCAPAFAIALVFAQLR